jgi:shikimate dehydrogenase
MDKPKIPLAGVIGCPIAHSLSPRIHAYWLSKYGLKGHYIPLHIERDDLKTTLITLPKMGFRGVNITIPYKQAVIDHASTISGTVEKLGAANTLSFDHDGKIHLDNTDGFGFIESIKHLYVNTTRPKDRALILGAGGASRAIIDALQKFGFQSLTIANRTQAKADALAHDFNALTLPWDKVQPNLDVFDLVVNTTALGMTGFPELDLEFHPKPAHQMIVVDIIYAPILTPFLISAQRVGHIAINGLDMLINQARPGFEKWFGTYPELDADIRSRVLG